MWPHIVKSKPKGLVSIILQRATTQIKCGVVALGRIILEVERLVIESCQIGVGRQFERAREVRRRFQGEGTSYTPVAVGFYGQ